MSNLRQPSNTPLAKAVVSWWPEVEADIKFYQHPLWRYPEAPEPNFKSGAWQASEVASLREWWPASVELSDIGRRLNRRPTAVMGMIRRLRIHRRPRLTDI